MPRPAAVAALVAGAALFASGCVFEERCVGEGVTRDPATGRCVPPEPPRTLREVVVGVAHACALDSNGDFSCWGSNDVGQLATGNVAPEAAPRTIDLGGSVLGFDCPATHLCARTDEPRVYCWGHNEHGAIGNGEMGETNIVFSPYEVPLTGSYVSVAAGFANTCATSASMTTRCWGRNDHGQTGTNDPSDYVLTPPAAVVQADDEMGGSQDLEGVTDVAIGDHHICLRDNGGALYCVGDNALGAVGVGMALMGDVPLAKRVPLANVVNVAAADNHTCAVVSSGQVYCWGENDQGQVAPDDTDRASVYFDPHLVPGLASVEEVVTGQMHACARTSAGEVLCWGSDQHGGLGDGMSTTSPPTAAAPVPGLTDVAALSASFLWLTCALHGDGQLSCWGEDAVGLIGGPTAGANTVFLDGELVHGSPVVVDPLR
jgi:alpha-tubulin suppressor-like RCC1 family protein